ncbi:MAG: hypothetical protein RIS36_2066 [Pseudomonadota bacterium]|jgi:hypothetical protein
MKKSSANGIELNEIKVRPDTSPHEIDDVETILSRRHPLGSRNSQNAHFGTLFHYPASDLSGGRST